MPRTAVVGVSHLLPGSRDGGEPDRLSSLISVWASASHQIRLKIDLLPVLGSQKK